jgi:hypothetical protein
MPTSPKPEAWRRDPLHGVYEPIQNVPTYCRATNILLDSA